MQISKCIFRSVDDSKLTNIPIINIGLATGITAGIVVLVRGGKIL